VKESLDIAHGLRELLVGGDIILGQLALLEDGLRLLLVLPESGFAGFGFEKFQAFAAGGRVKDSSARVRCAS
jgi:hypothetical protein